MLTAAERLRLETWFPRLTRGEFEKTSELDRSYNCIAFAAGDLSRWWEPNAIGGVYWPAGVPRRYTLESYQAAFATLGYEGCNDGDVQVGFEKVAIFVDARGIPLHAAKQLPDGQWSSKLGQWIDIRHELCEAVCGSPFPDSDYGTVAAYMRRSLTVSGQP
jgi:hypothetical protein